MFKVPERRSLSLERIQPTVLRFLDVKKTFGISVSVLKPNLEKARIQVSFCT